MTWRPATETPLESGWYACRLRLGGRPAVLWWSVGGDGWRSGATRQDVVEWLGPL